MAGELEGKTVLLVDDDRDILSAMEQAVSELGVATLAATDGNQAVEMSEQQAPDLVVLDQMLPKRSGFLVMERLRRQDPRPKVIMITGNQGQRHKVYAQSLGVDLYLNKPFRMEKLVESVKSLLS